ncbi:MAG TPA: hypothetical protein VIH21_12830 [Dehalococcoidia bacterium]
MSYPILAIAVLAISVLSLAFARFSGRFVLAGLAGGGAILVLHGGVYLNYTSDDAYISYRYAFHLADGAGLVWNNGEHVEGYSNFLWVMMLAALKFGGADLVWSGRVLGLISGAAAAGLTVVLTQQIGRRDELSKYAGVVAALALGTAGPFALWSYAGLETPFFAMLVAAAAVLHIRERDNDDVLPVSGVVWALAAMTRPDAIALFGVSAFFKASDLIFALEGADAGVRQAKIQRAALWLVGFAAIYVPYFAWRYATYGWLFPNSFYAKVGSGFDQYRRGLTYLLDFSKEYAAWLILLAPAALAVRGIRASAAMYLLALVAVWGLYVVYVGGDGLLRYRFFAEVLPLFYALVAASVASLLALVKVEDSRAPMLRAGAGCVIGAGLLAFTLQSTPNERRAVVVPGERRAVEERAEAGRWLRHNVDPTTSIAIMAAGAIPYESRLTTIDILGINDEHIAHRPVPLGEHPAGHEKFDSAYVIGRRPDAIILFDALEPVTFGRADYERLRFALTPAAGDMVSNPDLWKSYTERGIEVRDGEWFSLLVRNDSPLLEKTSPAP